MSCEKKLFFDSLAGVPVGLMAMTLDGPPEDKRIKRRLFETVSRDVKGIFFERLRFSTSDVDPRETVLVIKTVIGNDYRWMRNEGNEDPWVFAGEEWRSMEKKLLIKDVIQKIIRSENQIKEVVVSPHEALKMFLCDLIKIDDFIEAQEEGNMIKISSSTFRRTILGGLETASEHFGSFNEKDSEKIGKSIDWFQNQEEDFPLVINMDTDYVPSNEMVLERGA